MAALAAGPMLGTVVVADAALGWATDSRVNGLTVTGTQAVGTINGVPYVRTYGVDRGVVGEGEDLVGFAELPPSSRSSRPRRANPRTKSSSSIPRTAAAP
jgi:hypothetical protein